MLQACTVTSDGLANTRYGQYKHSSMIGKKYGSKVRPKNSVYISSSSTGLTILSNSQILSTSGAGFCYLLRPTPELW